MDELKVEREEQSLSSGENVAILRLSETIDAKTVVQLQNYLDQYRKDNPTRCFLLNLRNIRYVNSTGMGTLINVAEDIQGRGGAVIIVEIQPKVKIVFDTLGVQGYFKVFSTEGEGIKYLESKFKVQTGVAVKSVRRKRVSESQIRNDPGNVNKNTPQKSSSLSPTDRVVFKTGIIMPKKEEDTTSLDAVLVAEEVSESAVVEVAEDIFSPEESHKEGIGGESFSRKDIISEIRKLQNDVNILRKDITNITRMLRENSLYWRRLEEALKSFIGPRHNE